MARAGIGRIIPDRVVTPRKKPTQTAQFTKAQIEAKERAAATAAKAAQIARDRASSAAAFKASGLSASGFVKKIEAQERAVATTKPTTQSNNPATTTGNRAATTNNNPPVTSRNSGNQSNTGNPPSSGNDSGGSGQRSVPENFTSSDSISNKPVSSDTEKAPIKSAPIDTVIFADEAFAEEFLVDVLFEDIIGQELLSIARGDTVNGQDVIYQPIKNLGLLQGIYNPNNILGLADTSATFFSRFVIQLSEKIPTIARRRRSELGNPTPEKNYYVDQENGDIIIELINMLDDEQVEIQIATSGTIDRLGI